MDGYVKDNNGNCIKYETCPGKIYTKLNFSIYTKKKNHVLLK